MSGDTFPYPDRKTAAKLAEDRHRHQTRLDGTPFIRHPLSVARKADELLSAHYLAVHGYLFPTQKLYVESAYCAGLLHDTMEDCGLTFEDISSQSNLLVAQYVSELSHDNRLPQPRRLLEYAGRMSQAEMPVQVVKLADLWDNLTDAIELFKTISKNEERDELRLWLEECSTLYEALRRTRIEAEDVDADAARSSLLETMNWVRSTINDLSKICDRVSRRDAIMANILERQAREKEQARGKRKVR